MVYLESYAFMSLLRKGAICLLAPAVYVHSVGCTGPTNSPACNITTVLLTSYYYSSAHAPVIIACPPSCPVSNHEYSGLPLLHVLHLRSDFHALHSRVGHAFLLLCRSPLAQGSEPVRPAFCIGFGWMGLTVLHSAI
jgi:hypothetical protein